MKILFLSQRFLFPMDTGGKIRTGNILKQLSKNNDITLVSNFESPKDDSFKEKIEKLCNKFVAVPWREVKRFSPHFWCRLIFQTLSRYPVSVLNDYSKNLKSIVENLLQSERYDLAICDFVQSALMFKNVINTPTLLFQHNVESMILRRHLKRTRTPISWFWLIPADR